MTARSRTTRPHPSSAPRATRRAGATAALVLAAALTLSACSLAAADGAAAPSSDRVLRVGELGAAPTQEALLAAAGEDEGLDYAVEYSLFPSGPAFIEAVPSGAVDLALMADTPAIFAQVGGIPVKVVGVQKSVADGIGSVEIVAKPESGITGAADLAGKKVAVAPATILQYTTAKALEQVGLSYDDITPVELPLTDAAAALERGDVDAVASLDPQLAQLKAAGAVVVASGAGITSGHSFVVAADAALADDARSADVADYLERLGRAKEWAQAHQAEWAATYAEQTGLPVELATALFARQDAGWVPIDAGVIAAQQDQADTYTALGLITEPLDVSLEFDDRFNDTLAGGTE